MNDNEKAKDFITGLIVGILAGMVIAIAIFSLTSAFKWEDKDKGIVKVNNTLYQLTPVEKIYKDKEVKDETSSRRD